MAHSSDDQSTRLQLRPTVRRTGLLLAGLFLWSISMTSGCSQPEPTETRSGAETAKQAGEATRNKPSPVQYRTNTSDAGAPSDEPDESGDSSDSAEPDQTGSNEADAGASDDADDSTPMTSDAQ